LQGAVFWINLRAMTGMRPASPKRKKSKNEEQLLSEATHRLLRGIKAQAKKSGKPLTRDELLRRSYPKEFISLLEAA
jgi:hypothetical protein